MFLVANWKMNMTRTSIDQYLEALSESPAWSGLAASGIRVGLAPCHVYLEHVSREVRRRNLPVMVLAQDVSTRTSGAFTGEVGVPNVQDAGAGGVVIGHSERRRFFHETDETVVAKTRLVLEAGMTAIVCFGETAAEREKGETFSAVAGQVGPVVEGIRKAREHGFDGPVYLAYEPVWAIGSGRNATPADIGEVTNFVAEKFPWPEPPRFLYGGSVNADNIRVLSSLRDLSGFLVGSAWLDPRALLQSADLVRTSVRNERQGVHAK